MTLCSILTLSPFTPTTKAFASGIPVFDGANMAQNILTAIRTLQSNINEAKMILNQVKDLTKLPTTIRDEFSDDLHELFTQVGQIQGMMQDLTTLQTEFENLYPDFINSISPLTNERFSESMAKALEESRKSMLGAAKTGAQVLENIRSSQTQLDRLINASHGAVGNLQTQQAGNEITAVVASNLINLNAQIATLSQAQITYMQTHNLEKSANMKLMQDMLRGSGEMQPGGGAPRNPF